MRHEHDRRDLNVGFARWRDPTKRNVGFSPFPFFLWKNRKLTRMLMHLNDSHIIANIYFTTKDKSCESVYERKTTDGVTTT